MASETGHSPAESDESAYEEPPPQVASSSSRKRRLPKTSDNINEAALARAASPPAYSVGSGADLSASADGFWRHHIAIAETREQADIRRLPLPLSRIKKVMRADPDVKLIAGEVPYIFTKACEIFIAELSMRAWLVAESNSRVTLTRADVANAIQRSDQFDFLIDVCPREDANAPMRPPKSAKGKARNDSIEGSVFDASPLAGPSSAMFPPPPMLSDPLPPSMMVPRMQTEVPQARDPLEVPWSPSQLTTMYLPVSGEP